MHPLYASTVVVAVLACGCRDFSPPKGDVTLPIADREWDLAAPPEGWCGETSIQMAALHFGAWVPQRISNQLGKPKTPDLWEADVPVALAALGLDFETGPRTNLRELLTWTTKSLQQGHPVILGVKLQPTKHPEWEVDHLVLAVGFSADGLLLDTNLEGQQRSSWKGLMSREGERGFSLRNEKGTTFGYAVKGFTDQRTARLVVISESETEVVVKVEGARVTMRRGDDAPVVIDATQPQRLPRDEVTRFTSE